MTSTRPSEFRDALKVSPERIAHLRDTDLSELMRDLLYAQAHRCGSPLSEVRVNTEDKAKDDGCDGWTAAPAAKDEWLGETATCWQFKAGSAGSPARLKGEVSKALPRSTLEAGGRFVVVTSGSTNKKGEAARLKTLTDEASLAGIPTASIEVIGSERLTNWCNQNPAVAARWAGRPDALWRLSDWASDEVHQVPWHAPASVTDKIAQLRSSLEFETGSVRHLHIHGQPGVGKTRFALELCRGAPWSRFVIYLPQARDIRLCELIGGAVEDAAVRLVVVADGVQREQLIPLRDEVARANERIRLITIGHCTTPESERIQPIIVEPIDRDVAFKVVKGWYPSMPIEHIKFIVRFADGYIRLAKLAAFAVDRNPYIDIRDLLSRDEIRGFLSSMLGTNDRRALYVVAVLANVGWTDDVQNEGEAIARHFDLNWNDVRAKVDMFHRNFEIVPHGGRYRYISPAPLGIHLAIEAWTTYPDLLRTLPDALPTESAKNAYYERLRSIASNPQAREHARKELATFRRLDDFIDPVAVRRWSALSAADPNSAAANVVSALENTTPEERRRIADHARRETVSTLVRLAWRTETFFDATKGLALLAEAENEPWANNATAEFVARYQIVLGGTAMPYLDRLGLIDELVETGRTPLVSLAVKALSRVSEWRAFRRETDPASDEVPEKEWQPTTEQEQLKCVLGAIEHLAKLAALGTAEVEGAFVSAANDLAIMLCDGSTRNAVAKLFEALRSVYPDAREPLRRAIADIIHREREYWKELPEEEVAELDMLHADFEDASLQARVLQLVGQSQWDREEQPDLRAIAAEFVESPARLAEMWSWLTSGEAADGLRFGEALADQDTDGALLDIMQTADGHGRDLRVLCGYVSATRMRRGDEWYDDWVQAQLARIPLPLHMFFEVAWRCGATPQVAQGMQELLKSEQVAPEIVGQLSYGCWGQSLDPDSLAGLLRAMVDAGHQETALHLLERRIKLQPGEHDRWLRLALELITTPKLIRNEQNMTSHFWKELALQCIGNWPSKIAAAIFREHGDPSGETWFAEHTEAVQVLRACVEQNAESVWRMLEPWLSSKSYANWFCIGFPRGLLDRMPAVHIIQWVDADPDERAPIVAKLASNAFDNKDSLWSLVVAAHGDRDGVASAFFAEYVTGVWSGPASTHWEKLATSLEEVARRTKSRKLRRWAMNSAGSLNQMAERDRGREQEDDLRRE